MKTNGAIRQNACAKLANRCHSLHAFLLQLSIILTLILKSSLVAHASDTTLEPSLIEQARKLHTDAKSNALLELVEPLMEKGVFRHKERFEVLNMIVHAHMYNGDFDTANSVNKKIQIEALYGENDLYLGKSFLNEAEIAQRQGVLNEALQLQRQALRYYRRAGNKAFIANGLLEISYTLVDLNQNVEALDYANQSLAIGEQIENVEAIANAYHSIAMIHDNMGNFVLSLEAHQKTIQLDRERGDITELGTSYYNIANIFIKMDDFEQAEFYTQEALKLDLPGGNPEFLGHDYSRLADLAVKMGKPEEATEYALIAMQHFEKADAIGHMGMVHTILAKAYHQLNNEEQSQLHINKSIAINKEVNNSKQLTQSYIVMSEILLDQQQYEQALELITDTTPLPIEQKDFDQIRTLFMLKSQVYEAMNDDKNALAAWKDFYQLKDEFEAQNRTHILAQLQNQMEFLHKEHKIELLEKHSSIKQLLLERERLEKNLWIVGLTLFICLVAAILYRERTKRRIAAVERELLADAIEQKNTMLAEVAHELRSPLTALKLQVESLQYNLEDDPNAAYNRLNNKVAELNKLIEDLYDLARADNGLLKLNLESISVQDLVEDITEGYQEVVEHKGLHLKTQIQVQDSDYFTVDALRIKQVIVNLIRNSINYTNSPGTISCTARKSENKCEIILEDSAPGVSVEEIPRLFERMYRADDTRDKDQSGSGLGLSICKSLVEAHQGEIKASSSKLGGLRVKISLPIDKDSNQEVAR